VAPGHAQRLLRCALIVCAMWFSGVALGAPPAESLVARLKRGAAVADPAKFQQLIEEAKRGPRLRESDFALTVERAVEQIRALDISATTRNGYVVIDHAEEPTDPQARPGREPWMAVARARELAGAEPMTYDETVRRIEALGIKVTPGSRKGLVRSPGQRDPSHLARLYSSHTVGLETEHEGPAGDLLALAQRWKWEDQQIRQPPNLAILDEVRKLGFNASLRYGSIQRDPDGTAHEVLDMQLPRAVYMGFEIKGDRFTGSQAVPLEDAVAFARAWARLHRPPTTGEYKQLVVPEDARKAIEVARKLGFDVQLAEGDDENGKRELRVAVQPKGRNGSAYAGSRLVFELKDLEFATRFWAKKHRPPTDNERLNHTEKLP
jgi:hypothetical protein